MDSPVPGASVIRPAGDRALLVECASPAAFAAAAAGLSGVADVLPAARTVLITLEADGDAAAVAARLAGLVVAEVPPPAGPVLTVPVRYDGADLDAVARLLRWPPDRVIAAHTGTLWRCEFMGFAPGFGYLVPESGADRGADRGPGLTVPRRATPRVRIPAGAVALADGRSAVYPRATPGGWQLIGTTAARMWDVDRDPPALLRPGTRVRFEAR